MPGNRPNHRPAAVLLSLMLMMLVMPATAETLIDEAQLSASFNVTGTGNYDNENGRSILVYDISEYRDLTFVYCKGSLWSGSVSTVAANPSYNCPVTLSVGGTTIGSGTAGYNGLFNGAGTVIGIQIWVDIDEFDIGELYGPQTILLTPTSGTMFNGIRFVLPGSSFGASADRPAGFAFATPTDKRLHTGYHIVKSEYYWENQIDVTTDKINLIRNIDGRAYQSNIVASYDGVSFADSSTLDLQIPYVGSGSYTVTSPRGKIFSGVLGGGGSSSTTATATIYIVDSQTGYLLQGTDTRIQMMNASAEWEEVFNQTNFAGSAKIPLEKTTDPDGIPYYWIQSTRAGYQQVPETQIFSVYGDRQVIVEMEPTGGAPVDPGNAFVEFYVFDWLHNPINHVVVKIGGEYRYTNRQGWVQYELPKNTTYTYTLTAPGYITTTGSVVVGADPRYRVDVEMQVGTVPTNTPTPGPGATPPPRDTRTNEEKGKAVIDLIADNAELIATLAILAAVMGLINLIMPGRRRR